MRNDDDSRQGHYILFERDCYSLHRHNRQSLDMTGAKYEQVGTFSTPDKGYSNRRTSRVPYVGYILTYAHTAIPEVRFLCPGSTILAAYGTHSNSRFRSSYDNQYSLAQYTKS